MAGYIGSSVAGVATASEKKTVITATAGQTVFTANGGYTPNNLHVYYNGVRLVDGTDYTATNGSTVTLTTGAFVGDQVVIVAAGSYQNADSYTKAEQDASIETNSLTVNNNVGIGTDSPSRIVHASLSTASEDGFRISNSAGSSQLLTNASGDTRLVGSSAKNMIFDQAGDEAMRITSSGNLLVGTTDTNVTNNSGSGNEGININGNGTLRAARDGGAPAELNRLDSDGDIVQFRKDGSTVGSIGSSSGRLIVHGTNTGIRFAGSELMPTNGSGVATDNSVNIGHDSYRFKDLYLSGGVYLGGTGSANKLDDYEEGTWTPTNSGDSTGTVNSRGRYTKVGRQVTVHGTIAVTANFSSYYFGGLPFVPDQDTDISGLHGAFSVFHDSTSNVACLTLIDNSTQIGIRSGVNGAGGVLSPNTTMTTLRFSMTYQTTA